MTSLGIGLRSTQVPPREDADLQQDAAVEEREEVEELGHRCYDCAWLSLTALSTVTYNLWL
jgi:hypothetical protein